MTKSFLGKQTQLLQKALFPLSDSETESDSDDDFIIKKK